MSVEVTVEILGATQAELKALADKLPKAGKLSMRPMKDGLLFWKWKGFEILGVEEGLEEQATAKSENWLLDQPTRQALAELLTAFAKTCPRIFTLYAAVSGDLPRRESELPLADLLEVIAEGRLGNRVKYRVRELPPRIAEEPEEEPPA